MSSLLEKLNQCQIKPVVLSVVEDYADQFVVLFLLSQTQNLDIDYPALLRKCATLKLDISAKEINQVEMDPQSQAKGARFS